MKKIYLVINDASAHTSNQIESIVKERNRDYKCVYLTPYSSELNPIEQFWALVKGKTNCHKQKNTKTLEARIADTSHKIPIQHLENIIEHSKDQYIDSIIDEK
jgi:transposase